MATKEQTRLFVGNLPPDIQENDVKQEFSYYGAVDKVEIKQKNAPDSKEIQNTFAFVTISVDDFTLQQCLQEFKTQQFHGRFLQVTVARENFLEKLKREREEAAQLKSKKGDDTKQPDVKVNASLPTMSKGDSSESSSDESSEDEAPNVPPSVSQIGKSKTFKSSDSESESDGNEEDLVLKKKSKMFLENGKIKIDRSVSNGEAIHIIDKKSQKTIKRELDEQSKKADQKRVESQNKMKNSYNEQKLAIKKALAGVDTVKKSNKIVFDDDDDDAENKTQSVHKNQPTTKPQMSKKPSLFDEDGESDAEGNYEENFEIKQQFEGRKGERLRRLQDRFQGDSRFKMDSRFLEDADDGESGDEKANQADKAEKSIEDIETNENDERQWQLNILESVIGKKVHTKSNKDQKAPPSMLRFDPTRAEHSKFVEPKSKKRKAKANNTEPQSKRSKVDEDYEAEMEAEPIVNNEPPVSMDHFYEVRGDLKKSLGSGGFSLLSMFNRPADVAESTPVVEKPYEEKLIAKNGVKFLADFDPFKYDSSGDEADNDDKKGNIESSTQSDTKKSNLKLESFFIFVASDERLPEGLAFFNPSKSEDDIEVNTNEYDDSQRQELKNIVKRKIKKSIQNALPRNAKPNKRFKKFAKNL